MKLAVITMALFAGAFALANGAPAGAAPAEEKSQQQAHVTVQSGDTLEVIATANDTTYPRMFNANPQIDHPDVIYAGDKLRVPAKGEKLADRPLPGVAVAAAQPVAYQAAPAYNSYASQPAQQQTYAANYSYSQPQPVAQAAPVSADAGVWDKLAQCESGGNWSINTGNGYYGGLQFSQASWQGVGGSGTASQASKAEQIKRAEMLQQRQGWGAWPACSAKLGL